MPAVVRQVIEYAVAKAQMPRLLAHHFPSSQHPPRSHEMLIGGAGESLPRFSDIHPIKHAALGEISLFLTRRDGKDEIFYEAVFNHLH